MKTLQKKDKKKTSWRYQIELQSMIMPSIIWLAVFAYIPMFFLTVAFKDYNIVSGIGASPWVGFKYFKMLITDSSFFRVMRNTFGINLLGLLIGFPVPIIFALLLNELKNKFFKKTVQTSTYIPYFFSWAMFGGIILNFLSPSTGLLNDLLVNLGIVEDKINFMANPNYFWIIATLSNLVKTMGYGAIIYIAAIAGIDQSLYEAAKVDGANRFQMIWHITIPGIRGTIVIMLILSVASIMNTGVENIMILQNVFNLPTSETLDTYVYKIGLQQLNFSYASAVGLFKAVVSVVLLGITNYLSKKITNQGLF